jgi:hypothetical protein
MRESKKKLQPVMSQNKKKRRNMSSIPVFVLCFVSSSFLLLLLLLSKFQTCFSNLMTSDENVTRPKNCDFHSNLKKVRNHSSSCSFVFLFFSSFHRHIEFPFSFLTPSCERLYMVWNDIILYA